MGKATFTVRGQAIVRTACTPSTKRDAMASGDFDDTPA